MHRHWKISLVVTATVLALSVATPIVALPRQEVSPAPAPAVGAIGPDFALPDAYSGKSRSLREFARAKRRVALFFFCGCPACHGVAKEWAKYQRAGVLPVGTATVIVYSTTDRAEARHRIGTSGLDPKQTAVLCDTEALSVTETLYHAEPCPRIVVTNPVGKIVYMNLLDDEKPQEAPAERLTARALAALESSASSVSPTKP